MIESKRKIKINIVNYYVTHVTYKSDTFISFLIMDKELKLS